MYRLKKVKILSLAYTVTLIYLILGLIMGIVIAIAKTSPNPRLVNAVGPEVLNLSYVQIILLYPIAYAVGGFIISAVIGLIYNLVAKKTGGVAIELVKSAK